MNKSIVMVVVACLIFVLMVGWWIVKQKPQLQKGKVKVGVMAPLEGDNSSFGYSVLRGVQLAKKELGADNVEIVTEDSGCEAEKAKPAMEKLINKGVVAVIGEVCSGASLAALPAANKNKVVMISAASTSSKLSMANDYFFRTIPSDDLQGKFAAKVIYDKGYRKLAIMYTDEDYGQGFNKVLTESFTNLGGKVVANVSMVTNTIDLKTQGEQIKKSKPEVVFLVSNSTVSSVAALKLLKSMGVKVIYASEALNDETAINDVGTVAEGVFITAVSTGSKAFKYAHKTEFGMDAGLYSPQAYDAFYAIYQTISAGALSGEEVREKLTNVNFTGKSGKIVFDGRGEVSGNYELLVIKNKKTMPVN